MNGYQRLHTIKFYWAIQQSLYFSTLLKKEIRQEYSIPFIYNFRKELAKFPCFYIIVACAQSRCIIHITVYEEDEH